MPIYEFDVLVHGKSVTKFVHEGRVYIEGKARSEFTLLVRNNSADRVLAVMTVDGLSVMDGKKGSLDGNGYIVNAWQTLKIPGWRLDNEGVAKFVFGAIGGSYAAKKGAPRDIGVIGCAIFQEDRPAYTIDMGGLRGRVNITDLGGGTTTKTTSGPLRSRGISECSDALSSSNSIFYSNRVTNGEEVVCDSYVTTSDAFHPGGTFRPECSKGEEQTSGGVQVQNIGTEFGKRTAHSVTEVTFNKKDRPTEVFSVYYDDGAGLEKRGIHLKRAIQVAHPFPKDAEEGCDPPAGWRG